MMRQWLHCSWWQSAVWPDAYAHYWPRIIAHQFANGLINCEG
jgi:hypothetical protein